MAGGSVLIGEKYLINDPVGRNYSQISETQD
jgi:hypothetical protein